MPESNEPPALPDFEEVEHTADWALRISGRNLSELFRNAALGMLSLLDVDPLPGKSDYRSFELREEDSETLLVSWLEELLFLLEFERTVVVNFQVEVVDVGQLKATIELMKIASIKKEIKAITFNELNIQNTENGFETIVVFDV